MSTQEREIETKARFLKDVIDHEMVIIRDDGVYRHIRFKKPDCCAYHFDVLTWPGHLCVTGDMGTWVFARINDMFEFFRRPEVDINPGYWAEKLLAVDKQGGSAEFSRDRLNQVIAEHVAEYTQDWTSDRMLFIKRGLEEDLRDDVLSSESDESAFKAASEFQFNFKDDDGVKRQFRLYDFWENDLNVWTSGFLWNLYSIVWGIHKYDESKGQS